MPASLTLSGLRLSQDLWDQMHRHVAGCAPLEACGLLAGEEQEGLIRVTAVIPVSNVLASPVRYRMAPAEQLAAFNQIDENDWSTAGIFHSHPHGPDEPSSTDIAEAFYPEAVYLIWSGRTGVWQCRGFYIRSGLVLEAPLYLQA